MLSNSPFTLYNLIGYRKQVIVVLLDQRTFAVKIPPARVYDNPKFLFFQGGEER
jgi:hypothetical protein